MIKILAWLLLIIFSPLIIIIGSLVGVFMLIDAIICEMERILNYQIQPYITWKIKSVREKKLKISELRSRKQSVFVVNDEELAMEILEKYK